MEAANHRIADLIAASGEDKSPSVAKSAVDSSIHEDGADENREDGDDSGGSSRTTKRKKKRKRKREKVIVNDTDLNNLKRYLEKAQEAGLRDVRAIEHDGAASSKYLVASVALRTVFLAMSNEPVEKRKNFGYQQVLEYRPGPGAPCLRAIIEKELYAAHPGCIEGSNVFSSNWTQHKSKSGDAMRQMAMKADHDVEAANHRIADLIAASGEDKSPSVAKSAVGSSIHEDGADESSDDAAKQAAAAAGGAGFSIFVDGEGGPDKFSPREHNLNDEDTHGFGAVDISRIAPCDEDVTGAFHRHESVITSFGQYWVRSVNSSTPSVASSFNSRSRRTSHFIDCRDMEVPRCIRGSNPVKGTEIDLGGDVTAVVGKKLGEGAHGVALLCRSKNEGESFAGQDLLALKVQTPTGCLAHEHNILRLLEERVPHESIQERRGAKDAPFPFPRAFSYVQYDNGALLGMSAGSSTGINILDMVNVYKSKKEPIPELIAIHYTSRMLLHMETLHCVGKILHNDVKPDNWVVSGKNGADVTLVDFGRSADLLKAGKGDHLSVHFTGNEAAQDMACPAMRKEEPWCFETDAYGVVASSFLMLYGCHLETIEAADGKWTPTKKLKRYWAASLWTRIFRDLINAKSDDVPALMRATRQEFDEYLNEGKRRSHVEALLIHQETLLPDPAF